MTPPAPTTPRSRRCRLWRLTASALGVAVMAMALSGCVALTTSNFTQPGAIGDIDVAITGCASKKATTGCGLGTSNLESNATGSGQVLIGVRVKAAFVPPASFTTEFPESQPFVASPSYTAELTRLDPPDPGLKWAGYISDSRTYTPGKQVTVHIPVARPLLPDGSPNPSFFGASFVLGSRSVQPGFAADRPVTCGNDLSMASGDFTFCRDSQGGAGSAGAFSDFGFLTPAPVTVQPGGTAVIPVSGTLAGPAKPSINFALAASTTLPGATALVNVPTLAPPSDSTTTVSVSVPVPASAAAGTYAVTLTGTLGTGEKRSTTGTLIVAAPVAGPGGGATAGVPVLSGLTVSRTTISSARRSAPSVLSVSLSEPGRLIILLERRVSGRRKNGRCVAPTRALRRAGASPCARFVKVSSTTRSGLAAGVTRFSVSGRAAGRARTPGVYRVTFTSVSPAGVAGTPLSATLTITR